MQPGPADIRKSCGSPRWARLDLNQRPLACEASALPLSYAPGGLRRYHPSHDGLGKDDGGACPRRAAVGDPNLAARTSAVNIHLR
jgi:hypothetical protein